MVVILKSPKWYKSLFHKVHSVPTLTYRDSIGYKTPIAETPYDALEVLERFYSLINNHTNIVDLPTILRRIIIQDLEYSFCILCLKNKEQRLITASLITPNTKIINYTISLEDSKNALVKMFKSNKTQTITRDIRTKLNFNSNKNIKQIISIPISFQDKVLATLCVGSKIKDRQQDILLNLIAQQLSYVMANNELSSSLKQNLAIDPLTLLITHSQFQQRLNFELKRSERIQEPVSIMMIDLNNIKQINEIHSHIFGDEVISYIAGILKQNIRDIDIAARFSGSKMAVILPNTNLECTQLIARRFVKQVAESNFLDIRDITVSIGMSTFPDGSKSKLELLSNVDEALTIAKKESNKFKKSTIISDVDLQYLKQFDMKKGHVLFNDNKALYKTDIASEIMSHLQLANDMQYNSTILLEIISSLAAAIDAKDSYTRGHSQAVSKYAELLCHELDLSRQETEKIRIAALMHDIGKIGIPENVLSKPSQLDITEWEIMKQHPTIGARRIIQPISALNDLIPVVEHHHERWDGCGYPYGLEKDNIPLGARIVSIVDAFHTMTTDRPYRKSLGYNQAISILQNGAGAQWDSSLINSFLKISRSAHNSVQLK